MVQFSCLIAGRIRDILACDRANLSHTFVTHLWLDNIGIVAWHLTDVDGSCDRRSCVFVSSSTRRCTDISTGNFKMTIPLQRFRQIRFFSNALLNVDSNCLTYLDYAHMTTTCNLCQIFVRCWILRCNVLHFFTACSDSEDRPLDTSCRLPWSVVPLKLHDTSSNILNHLRLSLRQVLTECFLIDQSLVKWFVRFISDLSHWKSSVKYCLLSIIKIFFSIVNLPHYWRPILRSYPISDPISLWNKVQDMLLFCSN